MQIREDFELLESLFVESDLLEDGFVGVLFESHGHGDRCILLEVAPATCNRLLKISSKDRDLVCAILARELGGPFGPFKSRPW